MSDVQADTDSDEAQYPSAAAGRRAGSHQRQRNLKLVACSLGAVGYAPEGKPESCCDAAEHCIETACLHFCRMSCRRQQRASVHLCCASSCRHGAMAQKQLIGICMIWRCCLTPFHQGFQQGEVGNAECTHEPSPTGRRSRPARHQAPLSGMAAPLA